MFAERASWCVSSTELTPHGRSTKASISMEHGTGLFKQLFTKHPSVRFRVILMKFLGLHGIPVIQGAEDEEHWGAQGLAAHLADGLDGNPFEAISKDFRRCFVEETN